MCTDTEKDELIQVCDCRQGVRQGSGKSFLVGYGGTVPTNKEAREKVRVI